MKKLIAMILVLVTVLGLCACGNTGAGNNQGGSAGEKDYLTSEGKVKLSIGMAPNALIMDMKNNSLTKWVEEKCNVELEFKPFAGGTDIPTQISAALAAQQELPDICIGVALNEETMKRYGEDEYIVDLQDYYADKEGASKIFWDRINNELTERERKIVLSKIQDSESGAILTVPTVETALVDSIEAMAFINVEWLDKLQLEKPTNTEELIKVLRAFKENDCNGNGDKNDEIPLYGGTSSAGLCKDVTSWLMNMEGYYNSERPWMVDENGKLWLPYTTEAYRDGLRLINQLYKEGLLSNMMFAGVEKSIVTPTNQTALCGIFTAHLTTSAQMNNPVLYQYEPLKTWGTAVRKEITVLPRTFITYSCAEEKLDKAFEVLMTLWSWDGSMRQRYGEYGVNWTDADPGAKSDMGLDATYKLIDDPFSKQNTVRWPNMCCFNAYAECETAQTSEADEWIARRTAMHAEAYKLFCEAEKTNPVDQIAKPFATSTNMREEISSKNTNVQTERKQAFTDFITGANGRDINSDKSWKEYVDKLNELGLQEVLAAYQVEYDRTAEAE